MTEERAEYLSVEGKGIEWHGGRFRLLVAHVNLGNWRSGWRWIRRAADEMGWWTLLCGMDLWIQGVPIIRVTIAVNLVMWLLMWLVLRR